MPPHGKILEFASSRFWRRLIFWAGAAAIGVTALGLARASEFAFGFFEHMCRLYWWWPLLSLPMGGLLITLFMRLVGPGTEGSGIQQAIAALEAASEPEKVSRLINLRLALAKFASIVAGLGSGFILGLEGPTVQMGASALYALRRYLPFNDTALRRDLILAGGAAGIAAAFNAPIAGIMFAFEEMSSHIRAKSAHHVIVAILIAGSLPLLLGRQGSYFGDLSFGGLPDRRAFLAMLLAALGGGLLGGAFSWLAVHTARWLPAPLLNIKNNSPCLFVILCALGIAVCGLQAPIFGSGAAITKAALHGQATLDWSYMPLKFVGFLLSNLTSLPGGIFAPSLSLGAGLGEWLAHLAPLAWRPDILAVAMAATLAGVTRAPLTSAFIITEMTGGHDIIFQLIAATLIAAQIARRFKTRFYHDLAERALQSLPHSPCAAPVRDL